MITLSKFFISLADYRRIVFCLSGVGSDRHHQEKASFLRLTSSTLHRVSMQAFEILSDGL